MAALGMVLGAFIQAFLRQNAPEDRGQFGLVAPGHRIIARPSDRGQRVHIHPAHGFGQGIERVLPIEFAAQQARSSSVSATNT
jgi:hypothetical protein